ncbi:hypothetical protein MTBLM5_280014 [Magnetospirillum sp. LM-5]|uniref:hypothetical protein n=1 Tax=Magnetospirillum sp. LM-5 TaxID=2681466 RepID=UPI00137F8C9A|nr:hypothetical protein [Magnetospirillum sp. LM-5]CAA7618747.1 hypothetical protein MTBLM5_280014 [Magnetospirillum sp. LM-5]
MVFRHTVVRSPSARLRRLVALLGRDLAAEYPTAAWMAGGAVVAALALLLTRNLLNVAYGLAIFTVVVALSRTMWVRRAALAFLAATTLVSFDMPLPEMKRLNNLMTMTPLPPGEVRLFRFDLVNFAAHQRECGSLQGMVLVQGRDLDGFDISINGGELTPAKAEGMYSYQRLPMRLTATSEVVELRFRARPGHKPEFLLGAEVKGFEPYPQAVYLSFNNSRCRLVYHAKPESVREGGP